MVTVFANPQRFMALARWALPVAACVAAFLFLVGVPMALNAPPDARQGEAARIMHVHVPAAWWSMGVYVFMGVASFFSLVFRHSLADVAARAAAPIGAVFAFLCLVTGSLWGATTWGTFWVWDARLTSMLLLFLIYIGYIALWAAIEDAALAARLAAIFCLVGLAILPIIKFSVDWAFTLHQGATITTDEVARLARGEEGRNITRSMAAPLFTMAGAYGAAFAALLLAFMQAEIFRRRALAARTRRAALA